MSAAVIEIEPSERYGVKDAWRWRCDCGMSGAWWSDREKAVRLGDNHDCVRDLLSDPASWEQMDTLLSGEPIWPRSRWVLHNLVAHPLLVLVPPLGRWLHERTAPVGDGVTDG